MPLLVRCKAPQPMGILIRSGRLVVGVTASTAASCPRAQVLVHIEEQSPDIGQGVHGMGTKTLEETGAGDQVK